MKRALILLIIIVLAGVLTTFTAVQAINFGTLDQKAVAAYENARTAHQKAINLYRSALTDWQKAKQILSEKRDSINTTQAQEAARNLILRAGESMIAYLEMMRAGVAGIQGIDEADRNMILAEIDQDLAWLRNQKNEVLAAATAAQLKDEAATVRNYWNTIKPKVKRWNGLIMVGTVNRILGRLEGVSPKVDAQLDKLQAKGVDVTTLEGLVADFEAQVKEARANYNDAKARYLSIKSLGEADAFFNEGFADLKAADQAIRQAYKTLQDIVQEIKNLS